jgi:hypothetical protein
MSTLLRFVRWPHGQLFVPGAQLLGRAGPLQSDTSKPE